MKSKTSTRILPVILTKDEILELAKQSMEKTLQIDDINNQKAKLKGLQDEVVLLSHKMKRGLEDRPILCEISFNQPYNGKKTVTRTDTGEVVEILNMTSEEMQEDFSFVEAEVIEEVKQLTNGN